MSEKHFKDKGITYVTLAIICLIVFFVGYELMSSSNDNNIKDIFDVVLYKESGAIEKEDESNLEVLNQKIELEVFDTFILKSMFNSHSYMRYIYDEKINVDDINILSSFIKSVFSPKSYIKSQLPGILSLVDSIENDEEDKLNEDNVQVIDNINLVLSDDYYREDAQEVFNDIDESEDIDTEKFENIIFIDPYEDQNIEMPTEPNKIDEETLRKLSSSINRLDINENKPYILIYNTHGQESYLEAPNDNYHGTDKEYNVLRVSETISNNLKEKGHKLVYINKYHDIPMKESYTNAYKTIKNQTNIDDNIKVLIDVHRDGVSGSYETFLSEKGFKERVTINDKEVATFSLVIGPSNANKNELTNFAQYIKIVSDNIYPGLCSRIIEKPYGKFNQSLSDYSLLIEVGSNKNSIDEAVESAKLIADVLDKAINGIK